MARAFRRKGSRVIAGLDEDERGAVVVLLQQTRDLLGGDEPTSDDPLQALIRGLDTPAASAAEVEARDPALQRLLPPASRDDDELAADFRAMTEHSLRSRKSANLATAIAALSDGEGSKVELDLGQAQALLMALADVRLVLGERLGLQEDDDHDRLVAELQGVEDPDDPKLVLTAMYDFLTWMQETLAGALLR